MYFVFGYDEFRYVNYQIFDVFCVCGSGVFI